MSARKILFLTGTRADFGKLKPLIEQVEKSAEFESHIFVTGMHMLSRYGSTVEEITDHGFLNIHSYINQISTVNSQMDLVLANTIQGLGYHVREHTADLIVVHGDRVEALAGAIVGALNNVLVAHVEGGEVSGTVDELIRHAVSKLSHLHFTANEEAKERLIQMGEYARSIFVIGSPDVDIMLSNRVPSLSEAKRRYEIDFGEYAVFAYHPVTTELHVLKRNIKAVIDAVRASGWNFVVIYPNNDSGSGIIMEAILSLQGQPQFRLLPSMRFEYFLALLRHAKAIVGNSSSGVRDAPVYGVPSINIGSRQMNRFHHHSIVNVPEKKEDILEALNSLPISVAPSLHFGQGNSAEAFMAALRDSRLWETSRQKQFQDLGRIAPLAEPDSLVGA